jgi:ectoine hydroxylase-related dioxygenase (phytanoyl-CoA dioxygenase family)
MGISREQVDDYHRDGYLLLEGLLAADEVAVLLDAIEHGNRVASTKLTFEDAGGKSSNLAIWHSLGDDVWAAASTVPRIVNTVRILLGEDVHFYHGKVMLKEPHTGGSWEWHQDYGYWYADDQFAFPRMMSAFVALDPATSENGCLQVLRGSHKLGRLDHGLVGAQKGVAPERLRALEPLFEHVTCEMSPGSVLFFDCNLLHGSGPNMSERPRRSFIVAFNALTNPRLAPRAELDERSCPVGRDDAILTAPVG